MAAEILVVDDEADIRELVGGILQDEGFAVRTAGNSTDALAAVRARAPRLVVLDVWLKGSPELDALGILTMLKDMDPFLPVVVISGHGTVETAVEAIRRGAYDYLEKPFRRRRQNRHDPARHGKCRAQTRELASASALGIVA